MVVSGKYVGVVDPHKKCISAGDGQASGKRMKLDKFMRSTSHASCFSGLFGLSPTTTTYRATLFRFPLRQTASEISSNLYTPQKVRENLFESFKVEASLLLIFLKNVVKVSLYEYQEEPGNSYPVMSFLFGIEAKEAHSKSLQSERKYFQTLAQNFSEQSPQAGVQVLATTFVEKERDEDGGNEHHWLVVNTLGSDHSKLLSLCSELKVLPWVGLAVQFPTEFALHDCHSECLVTNDASSLVRILSELQPVLEAAQVSIPWCDHTAPHTGGQAFCFLPLPGRISLPVHVHGYFAVADNRRSIEWPQHDEKGSRAEWNKLLLNQLVAPAYALLLACRTLLLRYCNTPLMSEVTSGFLPDPFAAWPLLSEVKNQQIWSELLQPTLTLGSNFPLLWTAASGGKWIKIDEAYYLPNSFGPDTSAPCPVNIADLLVKAGKPVVFVPKHVSETLSANNALQALCLQHTITPHLVREVIKSCELVLLQANKATVDSLLEYVLSDLTSACYDELVGVPLLSLGSERTSARFERPTDTNARYVIDASQRHTLQFLPGLEEMVVDLESLSATSIRETLHEIAKTNALQFKLATPEVISTVLLQKSIQSWCKLRQSSSASAWTWSPGKSSQPPLDWITKLWQWLSNECIPLRNLSMRKLPIIPQQSLASHFESYTLFEIPVPGMSRLCALPAQISGAYTSQQMQALVEQLGLVVVDRFPAIFSHAEIHDFIPTASPEFVVETIVSELSKVETLGTGLRKTLRDIMTSHYSCNPIPPSSRAALCSVSVFEAGLGTTSTRFVSLEGSVLPPSAPPLPDSFQYPSNWLVCDDHATVSLIKKLGLKQPSFEDFCIEHLIPLALQQPNSSLICWVLEHASISHGSKLCHYLSNREIVGTRIKPLTFKRPSELYHCQEGAFQQLFNPDHDDVFPSDVYSDSIMLEKLKILGLNTWDQVKNNASFLVERARSVKTVLKRNKEAALRRSLFILSVLADVTDDGIMCGIANIPFLFAEIQRPSNYPPNLEWVGKSSQDHMKLHSVRDTCLPSQSENEGYLVGSVRPILSHEYPLRVPMESLQRLTFYIPTVADVISQLASLVASVQDVEKVNHTALQIYRYLSNRLREVSIQSLPSKWIWWKDKAKFLDSEKVILESPQGLNASLEPYYFTIEKNHELTDFIHLFHHCEVKRTINPADVLAVLRTIKGDLRCDHLPEHILVTACSILEWLYEVNFESQGDVLIPTNTGQLLPPEECTYDDREWVKQELGQRSSRFVFVHKKVPLYLARHFRVMPLSARVAPSSKLSIQYELAGPHETITHRIRQIIQEYATSIDIFKELVQNADDARATEIAFVIDWRSHPSNTLLSDTLKPWQGPALLVYNNAVFSDQDFDHICQLAGETKLKDPTKTGRFGVGFCATYHLTDLPSFISREYFTMFDPHTSYLGDRVSPREPGMRVNLIENQQDLKIYADQFSPYDGLFSCNVFSLPPGGFKGTLFRFPFRSAETAHRSEISEEKYTQDKVHGLTSALRKSASEILLFLKHVQKMSLSVIASDTVDTPEVKTMFSVEKGNASYDRVQLIKAYSQLQCTHQNSKAEICLYENDSLVSTTQWLLCSVLGTHRGHQLCSTEDGLKRGLVPLTEVALRVKPTAGYQTPDPVEGHIFCFLPLPIPSGLPFHINGFFDVGKDRRSLTATDDKTFGSEWNIALAEDALPQAILHLLAYLAAQTNMQNHLEKENFLKVYYSLCDFKSVTGTLLCHSMVPNFQKWLKSTTLKILWSEVQGGHWVTPSTSIILQQSLLTKDVYKAAFTVMLQKSYCMVDVPSHVYKMLKQVLLKQGHVYTYQTFCEQILFPNIEQVDHQLRDVHLLYLLEKTYTSTSYYKWAETLLKSSKCIPCQGCTPAKFLCPNQLIDCRQAHLAALYEVSEARFPDVAIQKSEHAMSSLLNLGMASHRLHMCDLQERTATVSKIALQDKEAARQRCLSILQYIDLAYHTSTSPAREQELRNGLRDVAFLPVLEKPEHVELPWWDGAAFATPQEAYLLDKQHLVFTQAPIITVGNIEEEQQLKSDYALRTLGIHNNQPTANMVLQQLVTLATHLSGTTVNATTRQLLDSVFSDIYKELQGSAHKQFKQIQESLKGLPYIWQDGHLLHTQQVLAKWSYGCYPYLCELSSTNLKFKELFINLGVKESASAPLLADILEQISRQYEQNPISDELLKFIEVVVGELCNKMKGKSGEADTMSFYLPDEGKVMRPTSKLTSDDVQADWVKKLEAFEDLCRGTSGHFVHQSIPRERAISLGVQPVLAAILSGLEDSEFLLGTEFGQQEDLCDRLNSILRKYPADSSMFQEFVQNAEDARASEVIFVLDNRDNFPDTKLFSYEENWKKLQHTPSLCIINNRKFTESDIKGITRLGRGAKEQSAEMIGRFGIGFNVAYHLSDCPSFVSYAEGGEPENFCFFDPTRSYAPRASKVHPGRRWKVSSDHISSFPDQFAPYLGQDLPHLAKLAPNCMQTLDKSGYVVFRLPLLRKSASTGLHSLSPPTKRPRQVLQLLQDFNAKSQSMLLFLNHVKHISAFEITKEGECVHYFSTCMAIPQEYQRECEEFTRRTRMARQAIQSGEAPCPVTSFHHVSTTHYTEIHHWRGSFCTKTKSEWIIQRTFGSRTIDETLLQCATSHSLQPIAGIAAPLGLQPELKCKVFCYLPMPLESKLPVHVNGHFVVDDSRKHFETVKHEGLAQWNQSLASNVIVPTYVDLLLKGREFVQESCEGKKWFYHLFPCSIDEGELGDLKLVEAIYKELWSRNLPILLYEPHSCPGGPGKLSQWKYLRADSQAYFFVGFLAQNTGKYISASKDLRLTLLQLGMHITSAPQKVYVCFERACKDVPLPIVDHSRVVSFLQALDISQNHIASVIKENIGHLLNFILDGYKRCQLSSVFWKVPLLIALDGSLRCTREIFESRFAALLPNHQHAFIDPDLERTDIGKILREQEASVIKPLPVKFVADNIALPRTTEPVSSAEIPPDLLKTLWEYLWYHERHNTSPLASTLEHFHHEPIIPTDSKTLYPVCMAKAVLNSSGDNDAVAGVMRKLGYSFLSYASIGLGEPIGLNQLTASWSSARDITQCLQLQYPLNLDAKLSKMEVIAFTGLLGCSSALTREMAKTLQKLHIFQYYDASFGPIDDRCKRAYILPQGVPVEGIVEVLEFHSWWLVLDPPDATARNFYKKVLDFHTCSNDACESTVEFYGSFIIPNLIRMSDRNIRHHIMFLSSQEVTLGERFERLQTQLTNTPLVPMEGRHSLVSDLYDPGVKFFQLFHPHQLPPKTWRQPIKLISFLRESLNLRQKVTTEDWLMHAKGIDSTDPDAVGKSEALLNLFVEALKDYCSNKDKCFIQVDEYNFLGFLRSAAEIPFIHSPPTQLELLLRNVFPGSDTGFVHHQRFVCFQGSVRFGDAELSALCKPVLPQICDQLPYGKDVWNAGLQIEFPLESGTVTRNLVTLCRLVTSKPTQMQTLCAAKEYQSHLKEILINHYQCLEKVFRNNNAALRALTNQACVLLKGTAFHLVRPSQVVRQLPGERDYAPFCYQVPDYLRSCPRLLEALGVHERLQVPQCVSILSDIHGELEQCSAETMCPETEYYNTAVEVYNHLVRCLRTNKDGNMVDMEGLYLPSEGGKVLKVQELTYNDAPWFTARLESITHYKVVRAPPADEKGNQTLPNSLNVVPLSSIVTEVLHQDMETEDILCIQEQLHTKRNRTHRCRFVQNIVSTLQSAELVDGLCRIYHHDYNVAPPDSFVDSASKLRDIDVVCIATELKTVLCEKGRPIPGTEDTNLLCRVVVKNGRNVLYIAPHTDQYHQERFLRELTTDIGKLLDRQIKDLLPLSAIIDCEPQRINEALNELRIAPYDPQASEHQFKHHNIGDPVSLEKITPVDLLVCADFTEGEEVVYQSDTVLRYAEVTKVSGEFLQISNKAVTIRTLLPSCESSPTKEQNEILQVSPLQLFKLLSPSQRQSLLSDTTTEMGFGTPVVLARIPCDDFEQMKQSLQEIYENVVYSPSQQISSFAVSLLTLRIVRHLHYCLVVRNQGEHLFLPAQMELRRLASRMHPYSCNIDPRAQPALYNLLKLVVEARRLSHEQESELPHGHDENEILPFRVLPQSSGVSPSGMYDGSIPVICAPSIAAQRSPMPALAHGLPQSGGPPPQHSRFGVPPHHRGYRHRPQMMSRFSREPVKVEAPPACLKSAQMWLEQAKADYLAARSLIPDTHEAAAGFPALVCFLCHEVVEKCMKGVLYAYCGLEPWLVSNSHLVVHLEQLKSSQHIPEHMKTPFGECVMQVTQHEYQSRLPNYQTPPCAPAAVYTHLDAREAITAVEKLLELVSHDEIAGELLGELLCPPRQRFRSTLQSMGERTEGTIP